MHALINYCCIKAAWRKRTGLVELFFKKSKRRGVRRPVSSSVCPCSGESRGRQNKTAYEHCVVRSRIIQRTILSRAFGSSSAEIGAENAAVCRWSSLVSVHWTPSITHHMHSRIRGVAIILFWEGIYSFFSYRRRAPSNFVNSKSRDI